MELTCDTKSQENGLMSVTIVWMVRKTSIINANSTFLVTLYITPISSVYTVWREGGGSGISRRCGGGCAGQWIHLF